ncbi:MAG: hypothetical protein AB8B82_05640 [Roseovarius sp.]
MSTQAHPFHDVAKLATLRGLEDLKLVVERDGAYVRMVLRNPDLLFMRKGDKLDSIDRNGFGMHTRIDLPPEAFADGPAGTLQAILDAGVAAHGETKFRHPLGDDHPFRAVHALAQDQNLHSLHIVDVYSGSLIRLYHRANQQVFKLKFDPGSAMDRQRFDYWDHHFLETDTPENLLAEIKRIIAEKGLT